MNKNVIIIAILVVGVLVYFLLTKKAQPTAEEQAAANLANAAAEEAQAEAALKNTQARAKNAIQDTIQNTSLTKEEKEEQIALQQKVEKEAKQQEIKLRYDKALAAYNALSIVEKYNLQTAEMKDQISKIANNLYKDMKGGNYHDASIWSDIENNFTTPAKNGNPQKILFFVYKYDQIDGNTLFPRMDKQKWHFIKPSYCSKTGKVYLQMKSKIDDFRAYYNDAKNNSNALNKKPGAVIPGYDGEIPEVYKS